MELENQLEQEQEALVNRLWKRMDKLEAEKRCYACSCVILYCDVFLQCYDAVHCAKAVAAGVKIEVCSGSP